jgi:tRNA(Ile)-lysidine synthetase-like protein
VVGPDPAVAAVRSAVRAGLADLPPGRLVLVACSGGADSLALAAGTAFCAARLGLWAGAVVVDHGWRPESAEVAATAAGSCRGLGLDPVDVVRVDATGPGGPEAAARSARYAALDRVARGRGAAVVLVGHTADDQAETVLLGLARGSGTRSLAGMPARRDLIRRPLLELTRDTTLAACRALGLEPWSDPANTDPAYARARLRGAMAELERLLGPGLVAALGRSAEMLREDAEVLDRMAVDLVAAATDPQLPGLDVGVLAAAPDALRRRALLVVLRRAGSPAGALGRRHVLAVDALLTRWHGQGPVHLPGRVRADRRCGRLMVRAVTGEQGHRVRTPPVDVSTPAGLDTRE